MRNLLTTPMLILVLHILVFGTLSTTAVACPDYQESGCEGGWSWFGLRHDGANVAQGQSVTLHCDAALESIEFLFRFSGGMNNGVPSMVAGDEISVSVMDSDFNVFTTVTVLAPDDLFQEWIEFSFPAGLVVPAGQYIIAAHTTAQGWSSMGFCYGAGADTYEGGSRITSLGGLQGPWSPIQEGPDIPFRLHLSDSSVAAENVQWDSLKGMYR
ncbi:MAG: hypothetical protein GY780_06780 [bacterium]|nr:hypothetical protein [bacterium]